MSARYYCDACGNELLPWEHKRLTGTLGRISFEVLVAVDGTWNKGHVCRYCLREAIKNAPQETEA